MTDLSSALGKLKRAAIDASMRGRDYRVTGDNYTFSYPGVPGTITRPGADGEGGGVVIAIPLEHPRAGASDDLIAQTKQNLADTLATVWSNIRAAIDSAVDAWHDLPKPATITESATGCEQLIAGLMGAVSQTGTVVSGAGELGSHLSRMSIESESFGGGAFDIFKQRYIDASPSRAVRLTALGEVLGQAVHAEAAIWEKVPEDLIELIEKYTRGFERLAEGDGGSISFLFKVLGAAVAGAAIFATAGTGTAIALAGAGVVINLGDAIAQEYGDTPPKEEKEFDDVATGISEFQSSIRALSSAIWREEGAVLAAVNDAITRVQTNAAMFQLEPAPIYEAQQDGVMYADPVRNLSLARTFMPSAAEAVTAMRAKPVQVANDLRSAVWRDYSVGSRMAGAAYGVLDLANVLTELLDEFAWDLDRGAENFELAILDWANQEGQNADAATNLANQIASGDTHDGEGADELLDIPPAVDPSRYAHNLGLITQMQGYDPSPEN